MGKHMTLSSPKVKMRKKRDVIKVRGHYDESEATTSSRKGKVNVLSLRFDINALFNLPVYLV